MQRIVVWAGVLLLLQIGLIAFTQYSGSNFAPYTPDEALVAFTPEEADTVIIDDGEGLSQSLEKKNGHWLLSASNGVPAAQVDALLQKLAEAKRGLAVARSKGAAARFGVAEDDFKHHLSVKKGDTVLADIFLGNSAGLRQLYARTEGSDDIVTVPLGESEVSAKSGDWVDREQISLDPATIKEVHCEDVVLTRGEEDSWLAAVADGEPQKSDAAGDLVQKIAALKVVDLASGKKAIEGDGQQKLSITLTLQDDSSLSYTMQKVDDTASIIQRSDLSFPLLISSWQVDELRKGLSEIKNPEPEKDKAEPESQEQQDAVK